MITKKDFAELDSLQNKKNQIESRINKYITQIMKLWAEVHGEDYHNWYYQNAFDEYNDYYEGDGEFYVNASNVIEIMYETDGEGNWFDIPVDWLHMSLAELEALFKKTMTEAEAKRVMEEETKLQKECDRLIKTKAIAAKLKSITKDIDFNNIDLEVLAKELTQKE